MKNERTVWRSERRAARRAWLGAIPTDERARQEQALAALLVPHLGPPGILGAHIAVGDEIGISTVLQKARALGWQVALPRAAAGQPLSFHVAPADAALGTGAYGIPEPAADIPRVRPDLLLVPLIAVDTQGNRLGQGGGHYDRTLAQLRATGPILAIAIAWDMQLVPNVPSEAWDQRVDAIATPTAFHLTGAGGIRH